LIILVGGLLAPVLGVGAVTMLGLFLLGSAMLTLGDRAGLFRFKPDEFIDYMKTPPRLDLNADKRSAATVTAVPGSIISSLVITFMADAQIGMPAFFAPAVFIALSLVLVTIASANGRITDSARESILTLLMVLTLFGYGYGSEQDPACGETEATGLSIECEPSN
jgi:hypothetical protein